MRGRLFWGMIAVLVSFIFIVGQGASKPLPKIMQALAGAKWKAVDKQFHWKAVKVKDYDIVFHAWKIQSSAYDVKIVQQKKNTGSFVKELRNSENAILAINGGYFEIDKNSKLTPSGLLLLQNKEVSTYNKKAGSALLYEKNKQIGITWSKAADKLKGLSQALQSGPMLVDPGGKNGIYRDDHKRHNRTAICLTKDNQLAFFIVTGGLTLFELGIILSSNIEKGGFSCERAINLDGGPSTQVSFKNSKNKQHVEIPGEWAVQNAILVLRKEK